MYRNQAKTKHFLIREREKTAVKMMTKTVFVDLFIFMREKIGQKCFRLYSNNIKFVFGFR